MNNKNCVLVVEDEVPLSDIICIGLQKSGFEVATARSVEEAKGCLKGAENVNAVWLDHYLLGKETGLDFITWCKADTSPYKSIPFFVVTNTSEVDSHTYLSLGATKYYIKAEKRLCEIIADIHECLNCNSPKKD